MLVARTVHIFHLRTDGGMGCIGDVTHQNLLAATCHATHLRASRSFKTIHRDRQNRLAAGSTTQPQRTRLHTNLLEARHHFASLFSFARAADTHRFWRPTRRSSKIIRSRLARIPRAAFSRSPATAIYSDLLLSKLTLLRFCRKNSQSFGSILFARCTEAANECYAFVAFYSIPLCQEKK